MITDLDKLSPDSTESAFINCDCMEAMRRFPDNYFDLAIVDPPYGDGGGTFASGTRFGERFDRYKSGGWHGKQKYHLGTPTEKELPKAGRNMGLPELGEHGRRNTEKNHCVGCCPGAGVF